MSQEDCIRFDFSVCVCLSELCLSVSCSQTILHPTYFRNYELTLACKESVGWAQRGCACVCSRVCVLCVSRCVYVCVCSHARLCVCVCSRACVCSRVFVLVRARTCVLACVFVCVSLCLKAQFKHL